MSSDVEENLERVRAGITNAANENGRTPDAVTLVAATKMVDADRIRLAVSLGLRVFGENRVQEGKHKWPALKDEHPGIELHLLGPLQTNKVRDAVALFDVIQSVDRADVATAIAKERDKQGRQPKIFIQINTGREPQKSGAMPHEAAGLISVCRAQCGLDVAGLMCIPPVGSDPGADFTLLREIAIDTDVKCLSMGMSGDFVRAIENGATHVRIGSAIFGKRAQLA